MPPRWTQPTEKYPERPPEVIKRGMSPDDLALDEGRHSIADVIAELKRMRHLLRIARWTGRMQDACPWCGWGVDDESHHKDCPAYDFDGVPKWVGADLDHDAILKKEQALQKALREEI